MGMKRSEKRVLVVNSRRESVLNELELGLHRAGFKPAMVADLGFARAERYASEGEKLVPPPGRAICFTARDDADWRWRTGVLAYWWPEAGGLLGYWHCSVTRDERALMATACTGAQARAKVRRSCLPTSHAARYISAMNAMHMTVTTTT